MEREYLMSKKSIGNIEPKTLLDRPAGVALWTIKNKRNMPVEVGLIRKHADSAAREGYRIFSCHLDDALDFPPDWEKPLPDLLIKRLNRSIAYLYETSESIENGKAISRWETFENLKEIQVRLVVENRKTARIASKIKKERGFQAQIRCLRPHQPKRLRRIRMKKALTPNKIAYASAAAVALLASLFVSGVIPNFFELIGRFNPDFQKQAKIYQPKDIERQLQSISRIVHRQVK